MRTRSSPNLPVESSPNPTTSNPKRRNRRHSKQHFILEESPVDTMVDQRTMAELLRAPTEGYVEAIVGPPILAEQFELKHNQYKDLLRTCPHHGFPELYQLDTFYNALNPADQDSLNSVAGGNLDANSSSSSEITKLTHAVNQQTSAVTTAMTAILKQFQATPPPAFVKAIEEICVTYGAAAVNYNQGNSGYRPLEEDERVKETLTDQDLAEYTIKVPPPLLHINITLADALILVPKYQKMLKALLSDKEKLLEVANIPFNENCSAVILKKLHEKLGDPGKFLILCAFSELMCKALADLGAIINLMPLSVWKMLGLPELISTRMTLELANRAIYTPAGIARDVFVSVGKFTFPANFFIVDYESDPRVPLILGRPFLRIARALIDVHREEMILRDGDERLTLNMRHDTSSYSNQPQKESINMINIYNDLSEDFLEDFLVPATSNSYYQGFNVKSLFGEIDCPKKSQVKIKGQIKMIHLQGDLTTLKCHIKAQIQESQSMNI
nr:reverse transcriptase domain-containing protein [Tanacetum cinerariifolium]